MNFTGRRFKLITNKRGVGTRLLHPEGTETPGWRGKDDLLIGVGVRNVVVYMRLV